MPRFTEQEERYMSKALALARKGLGQTSPNPMVGCLIVKNDQIIGRGYHRKAGGPHAEVVALRSLKTNPAGATIYITLEPCIHQGQTPPCLGPIIEAGISEAIIAMPDPNPIVNKKGIRGLRHGGIRVRTGLLEREAQQLNEAFVTYHTLKRPFIIAKWAITLDGRTATDSGSSKWISNPASRHYVHVLRSQVDAVMVGIGTVIKDNPRLDVRLPNYKGRQPRRIIIDGHLKTPTRCNCLSLDKGGLAIVIAAEKAAPEKRVKAIRDFGHSVIFIKGAGGIVRLEEAFQKLHEVGIQSILVEGGRRIHTSLLERGLVDRVVGFVTPKVIGGGAIRNPIEGWGVQDMGQCLELDDVKIQKFDDDVCIEGYIRRATRKRSR
ncbi:bifunctional diaminohydroxyphosphoribosylaminopyrimidine deaminase/5-amino-6-(5-phosphoribosylamino)uracil reductase RibD [Candidatus Sumerlaeota bacterium]